MHCAQKRERERERGEVKIFKTFRRVEMSAFLGKQQLLKTEVLGTETIKGSNCHLRAYSKSKIVVQNSAA